MPNPLVALGGASLAGGIFGAREASKASDRAVAAQSAATDRTIDESARQYDQTREDTRVARETGDDALMTLGYLLGVKRPPSAEDIAGLEKKLAEAKALRRTSAGRQAEGTAPGSRTIGMPQQGLGRDRPLGSNDQVSSVPATPADIGAIDKNISDIQTRLKQARKMQQISEQYAGGIGDFIKAQPGYEFGLQEGNNALTNVLTAGGASQGGRAMKAAERFGIDYAGSKTDEHLSRLFTLAGYGPAGVNTSAQAGMTHAGNVGNANTALSNSIGDAAYNNAAARVGGVNNAINTGVSLWTYNDYMNRMRPGATS